MRRYEGNIAVVSSRRRWKDNINRVSKCAMDRGVDWSVSEWGKIFYLLPMQWNLELKNIRGIFWLVEEQLASQKGLFCNYFSWWLEQSRELAWERTCWVNAILFCSIKRNLLPNWQVSCYEQLWIVTSQYCLITTLSLNKIRYRWCNTIDE